MEKSKLGISIPLTGALIFFLVFVSDLVAILLAAFVLLYEDNEWLKKSAIKMISVIIVSGMFLVFFDTIDDVFSILDIAFGWIIDIDVPFELDRIGSYVVYAAEKLLLLSFGLKALSMGTIKAKFFDKIINNHM
ncbi:hypothetical protein [Fusibacter sp. JL216-2]|uniref:hypothetical protein n=1 Tax=Fusibacter sp. JL216-2 TaxID=3071453 RepID=UPI003D355A0F